MQVTAESTVCVFHKNAELHLIMFINVDVIALKSFFHEAFFRI